MSDLSVAITASTSAPPTSPPTSPPTTPPINPPRACVPRPCMCPAVIVLLVPPALPAIALEAAPATLVLGSSVWRPAYRCHAMRHVASFRRDRSNSRADTGALRLSARSERARRSVKGPELIDHAGDRADADREQQERGDQRERGGESALAVNET